MNSDEIQPEGASFRKIPCYPPTQNSLFRARASPPVKRKKYLCAQVFYLRRERRSSLYDITFPVFFPVTKRRENRPALGTNQRADEHRHADANRREFDNWRHATQQVKKQVPLHRKNAPSRTSRRIMRLLQRGLARKISRPAGFLVPSIAPRAFAV